jgi:hypothetical protein
MNNFEAPLVNERFEKIISEVEALDIGLDLRRHPELCARLMEIGAHFDDSLHMARIIRAVYGPLQTALGLEDEGPERLMRAAVLHDIGKSGPAGEEGDFNRAVQKLFIPPARPFSPYENSRARTIVEFMASQGWSEPESAEVRAVLEAAGVDPDTRPMIDFWRRHAQWTLDILSPETSPDIDAEVVAAAASHHLYEGRDPLNFLTDLAAAPEQELKMANALEIIDKYQANRVRWARNHEDSLAWLEGVLSKRTDLPPVLAANYRAIIKVLRDSEGLLS